VPKSVKETPLRHGHDFRPRPLRPGFFFTGCLCFPAANRLHVEPMSWRALSMHAIRARGSRPHNRKPSVCRRQGKLNYGTSAVFHQHGFPRFDRPQDPTLVTFVGLTRMTLRVVSLTNTTTPSVVPNMTPIRPRAGSSAGTRGGVDFGGSTAASPPCLAGHAEVAIGSVHSFAAPPKADNGQQDPHPRPLDAAGRRLDHQLIDE
jgi:hypothetical protein